MKSKSLLWIDDDARLVDKAKPIFAHYGFLVLEATNTSRALTILRTYPLDGILLDVRLSAGENGLELLAHIRSIYPRLPVAIFTAYPDYVDHVEAEHSGAVAYLHKVNKRIPLNAEERARFFSALHQIFPASEEPARPRTGLKGSATQYDLGAIRELLLAAFSPEELRRFCQDRPLFRPIVNRFGPGSALQDMTDHIINYCETNLLFEGLLAEVAKLNPRQYARFEPDLLSSATATPANKEELPEEPE